MNYKKIAISTITPKLGAEISGVDLANLDDETIKEVHHAFKEHMVLVFRDQQMNRDQHKAFGRTFGELQTHPAKTNLGAPGDPEIFDIKITADTKVANGESWHTDLSCEPIHPWPRPSTLPRCPLVVAETLCLPICTKLIAPYRSQSKNY